MSIKKCQKAALHATINAIHKRLNVDKTDFMNLYLVSRKIVHERHNGPAASHSRLFYFQEMIEKLCETSEVLFISLLYNLYWDTYIDEMTLFEDVPSFFNEFRLNNIPIYVYKNKSN